MRIEKLMQLRSLEQIHTESYVKYINNRIKELEAASEGLYRLISRDGGPFKDDEALIDMIKQYKQELIMRKSALLGVQQ